MPPSPPLGRSGHRLLAGDPAGAAVGHAPGAVDDRSRRAHEVGVEHPSSGVEHERGGAPDPHRVVLGSDGGVDATSGGPRRRAELVVPDEHHRAAAAEGRHAVEGAWHGRAVGHGLPDAREGDVLEPVGQGEDVVAVLVGDPAQGPVAAPDPPTPTGAPGSAGGAGHTGQGVEEGGAGRRPGDGRAPEDEGSAIEATHGPSLGWRDGDHRHRTVAGRRVGGGRGNGGRRPGEHRSVPAWPCGAAVARRGARPPGRPRPSLRGTARPAPRGPGFGGHGPAAGWQGTMGPCRRVGRR